jgi:hypothetical protein
VKCTHENHFVALVIIGAGNHRRARRAGWHQIAARQRRNHAAWARGYHRVLRVARTLADLDGAAKIGRLHLAEGLSYRARGGICGGRREMARFRGVSRVSFDITRRFRPAALVNAMLTNAFMTLMPLKLFSLNRPER